MYQIYLGKILLPIAPAKIDISFKNQNKTINLVSGDEINLIKKDGLAAISFDFLLPSQKYPFAQGEFKPQSYYLEQLLKLKTDKKSFLFVIHRGSGLHDTKFLASLEDWKQIEDKNDFGKDIKITVKLKQYKPFGVKKYAVVGENAVQVKDTRQGESPLKPTTKPIEYKVKQGDTLWAIAKKHYGDGEKYKEVAKTNGISNPSLVHPGAVLIMPALI